MTGSTHSFALYDQKSDYYPENYSSRPKMNSRPVSFEVDLAVFPSVDFSAAKSGDDINYSQVREMAAKYQERATKMNARFAFDSGSRHAYEDNSITSQGSREYESAHYSDECTGVIVPREWLKKFSHQGLPADIVRELMSQKDFSPMDDTTTTETFESISEKRSAQPSSVYSMPTRISDTGVEIFGPKHQLQGEKPNSQVLTGVESVKQQDDHQEDECNHSKTDTGSLTAPWGFPSSVGVRMNRTLPSVDHFTNWMGCGPSFSDYQGSNTYNNNNRQQRSNHRGTINGQGLLTTSHNSPSKNMDNLPSAFTPHHDLNELLLQNQRDDCTSSMRYRVGGGNSIPRDYHSLSMMSESVQDLQRKVQYLTSKLEKQGDCISMIMNQLRTKNNSLGADDALGCFGLDRSQSASHDRTDEMAQQNNAFARLTKSFAQNQDMTSAREDAFNHYSAPKYPIPEPKTSTPSLPYTPSPTINAQTMESMTGGGATQNSALRATPDKESALYPSFDSRRQPNGGRIQLNNDEFERVKKDIIASELAENNKVVIHVKTDQFSEERVRDEMHERCPGITEGIVDVNIYDKSKTLILTYLDGRHAQSAAQTLQSHLRKIAHSGAVPSDLIKSVGISKPPIIRDLRAYSQRVKERYPDFPIVVYAEMPVLGKVFPEGRKTLHAFRVEWAAEARYALGDRVCSNDSSPYFTSRDDSVIVFLSRHENGVFECKVADLKKENIKNKLIQADQWPVNVPY